MERLNKTMTEFVLEQSENKPFVQRFTDCFNYAKFISQKPELWMFIPCGSDGSPFNYSQHGTKEDYQQALDKVIFDEVTDVRTWHDEVYFFCGKNEFTFDLVESVLFTDEKEIKTLEDLITYNLKLRNNDKAGSD